MKPLSVFFDFSLFRSPSCAEFNPQNLLEGMAKRQQVGDYDDQIKADQKIGIEERSFAERSTTSSSTVSSSLGILGSEEYEMRYEIRTKKPRS